jgi:hypothetical protein
MKTGEYVMVIAVPAPWESSGETLLDREAFLGHVGIVLEVEEGQYEQCFVAFPSPVYGEPVGTRWFESESLQTVSSPPAPITKLLWEN